MTPATKIPGERPLTIVPHHAEALVTGKEGANSVDAITLAVRRQVEGTYLTDDGSPYHGMSHPYNVLRAAAQIAERAREYGISVDMVALERAILLHDALQHLQPQLFGFQWAEELAAHYSYNFLILQGCPEQEARKVASIIMASNPMVEPKTPEEIIMRAADLWSVAQSFPMFKAGTEALHLEAMKRSGEPIEFRDFVKKSFSYLQLFVWRYLSLTPESREADGSSVWHKGVIGNLAKLAEEVAPPDKKFRVVAELFDPTKPVSFPAEEPGETIFYIAMATQESSRESLLSSLRAIDKKPSSGFFVIPGSASAFSIPNGICDEVLVSELNESIYTQAKRVLKAGGKVRLDRLETISID